VSAPAAIATPRPALPLPALLPLAATVAALLVGLVLVSLTARDGVDEALLAFWDGVAGSSYALGASLNRAAVLALVATGFVLAARASLTNVGGEGQIAAGGIAATAVALYGGAAGLPAGLPALLPLLAAGLAGAALGGLAGVLKVRFGTSEVISTLLMTFVALLAVYWAVQSEDLLRKPRTSSATLPESAALPPATHLPLLTDDPASPLHVGIVVAAVALLVAWVLMHRTTFGMALLTVGLNGTAARRAGIATGAVGVGALAMSGLLPGFAGALMIQGDQQYLTTGFSSGYGFDGLVVGLLSRGSAVGIVAGALAFGFLRSGGLAMEILAGVPSAVVDIIQGLVVVAVAGTAFLLERR
jgi:simple sugar transport system permease protein